MPRRKRLRGKLIQKPKELVKEAQQFKIIAENQSPQNFWVFGEYSSFEIAKQEIDKLHTPDVNYYIYSDLNTVLYTKKGE